jgi:hypothetical protein
VYAAALTIKQPSLTVVESQPVNVVGWLCDLLLLLLLLLLLPAAAGCGLAHPPPAAAAVQVLPEGSAAHAVCITFGRGLRGDSC